MARGVFEFKFIKPSLLDAAAVEAEVYKTLDAEGDIVRRMYEATTRTWSKRPRFWKAVGRSPRKAGVRVYTDDKIYPILDYGARKKGWWITAKRAPMLRWRWPYKSKTSPRVIGSHAGGRGSNWASKRRVWHPAHKPREWTAEIQARRDGPFQKSLQAAIDKGLRKTRRMRG